MCSSLVDSGAARDALALAVVCGVVFAEETRIQRLWLPCTLRRCGWSASTVTSR